MAFRGSEEALNTVPVLFVHGIFDSGARFGKMQAALTARGFDNLEAMAITPADASISMETMGAQVRSAVYALLQSSGASKIDIIAFSMGALAVRFFLQKLEGRDVVRRFISISGPHHGTWTAYLTRKPGARQMRPGSALLQELNTEANPWSNVEVFSFWSPYDRMVIPPHSSILPHAQNRAFNVFVHHWMLTDREVIEAVVHTLESP